VRGDFTLDLPFVHPGPRECVAQLRAGYRAAEVIEVRLVGAVSRRALRGQADFCASESDKLDN